MKEKVLNKFTKTSYTLTIIKQYMFRLKLNKEEKKDEREKVFKENVFQND